MVKPPHRSSQKKKRPPSTPKPFSDILPAVGQLMHLDEKVREWTVLSLWDRVLDPAFQGKVRAVMVKTKGKQKQLVVKATDSTVASELTFFLEQYKAKINAYRQETGCEIHHIDIWIGT